MSPSARKAIGALAVLAFLTLWIVIAATVGSWLVGWPWWAQGLYYAAAGIVWVFPLRPLLAWMNRQP